MGLVTASSTNYDLPPMTMVIGYYIYDIMEKDVADIRDLLVDEKTRKPRYAVIEVGGLMSIRGKIILIPWTLLAKGGISRLDINCPEEQIFAAPTALEALAPNRVEEESIHRYFNAEPYWESEPAEAETEEEESPDSEPKPPAKPVDDKPLEDLSLENDE